MGREREEGGWERSQLVGHLGCRLLSFSLCCGGKYGVFFFFFFLFLPFHVAWE